ncbi:MAG: 2-phospho-L-lactate transferase [Actinomycetota bacterium]|jgi:LPPG:FO 2-phospho-L-lactate transferase|nr:2-phospho-L-lactate transferase [Actinomycetota bacterium]
MLTALAGGVGAARLLRGLVAVVDDPASLTAVVNTGDDIVLHGLSISPDLDTITYTLAGAISTSQGWGLEGETWNAMSSLDRYGGQSWFRLGDRDLATHLYRTQRLSEGASLTSVTAEIVSAWGLGLRLLPMSDDRVETRVTLAGSGAEIGFQEYFVGRQHSVPVSGVRFVGAPSARPGPEVLPSIVGAERVIVCPSNPIVSIGPVLAVPGVRDALVARRASVVAVSPIIAGAALKGPADRLLVELGHESSVVGVARLYADFVGTLVIDSADAALAAAVESEGVRAVVAPTIMSGPDETVALAKVVLSC